MDIIENIEGSLVQHGQHNNRIYLMKLNTDDALGLISILDDMALKNSYGKIFAKVPAPSWRAFKSAGYIKEAVVPGFFNGKTDGLFIAKYFSDRRQTIDDDEKRFSPAAHADNNSVNTILQTVKAGRNVGPCNPLDANEMSAVYRQVFHSYPFPIQQPAYLCQMMKEGVLYFSIRAEGRIAAISGAEIDFVSKNAEMTDFATLPKYRGRGFAGMLLGHMEKEIRELGVKTAYTIARAASGGMNAVFKNRGYSYAGLLKNNTRISGSIQSMTVWYKHI